MKNLDLGIAIALFLSVLQPVPYAHAWGAFDGGHHPEHDPHWGHQNPVVVHNVYVHHDTGGCIGCGFGVAAVAGLVGGALIGSAIANSNSQPDYYAPPPPPMPPQYVVQAGPPPGTEVATLPGGCASMNVNGGTYYQCGPVWYQPFFGGNGVYYTVVPAP